MMLGLLYVCGCTAAQTGKQAETDSAPDTSAHTDSKTDSDTDTGLPDTDMAEPVHNGEIKPLSTVSRHCCTLHVDLFQFTFWRVRWDPRL